MFQPCNLDNRRMVELGNRQALPRMLEKYMLRALSTIIAGENMFIWCCYARLRAISMIRHDQ